MAVVAMAGSKARGLSLPDRTIGSILGFCRFIDQNLGGGRCAAAVDTTGCHQTRQFQEKPAHGRIVRKLLLALTVPSMTRREAFSRLLMRLIMRRMAPHSQLIRRRQTAPLTAA
jgi:hypothetical protein